jgi:hypothetical protein
MPTRTTRPSPEGHRANANNAETPQTYHSRPNRDLPQQDTKMTENQETFSTRNRAKKKFKPELPLQYQPDPHHVNMSACKPNQCDASKRCRLRQNQLNRYFTIPSLKQHLNTDPNLPKQITENYRKAFTTLTAFCTCCKCEQKCTPCRILHVHDHLLFFQSLFNQCTPISTTTQ